MKSSVFAAPNVLSELRAIDRARNENLLIPNHELSLMPEKYIGAEKEREREKKKTHNRTTICVKKKKKKNNNSNAQFYKNVQPLSVLATDGFSFGGREMSFWPKECMSHKETNSFLRHL